MDLTVIWAFIIAFGIAASVASNTVPATPPCVVDCENPVPHTAATAIRQIAARLILRSQLICIWSPKELLMF